jgi:phage FluMu gp28-like protein
MDTTTGTAESAKTFMRPSRLEEAIEIRERIKKFADDWCLTDYRAESEILSPDGHHSYGGRNSR